MGGEREWSVSPRSSRSATRSTWISAICSISSRSIARTRAILLYVEAIGNVRKFMSAARAAARVKPVVVIKSGRHAQGAKAAATHTGALAGSDAVYDAAFRRAGLLRVLDLEELFAAAETLGRLRPFTGNRLAILTNGGGIGVLAVDRLADLGGTLAGLSPPTMTGSTRRCRRSGRRPIPSISPAMPINHATRSRWKRCSAIPANDAILVMNVPTALASPADAARSVADVTQRHRNSVVRAKPVFAVWVGGSGPSDAAAAFEAAGIPSYADRIRRGRRVHAPRALPGGDRRLDGDAAEPAGGVHARRGRRPPHHRGRST